MAANFDILMGYEISFWSYPPSILWASWWHWAPCGFMPRIYSRHLICWDNTLYLFDYFGSDSILTLTGLVTMCLGFVKDFGSFATVRALLGLAEGGMFPAIILYLSYMYKRDDLALRIGIFYSGAGLAGAFGGNLNNIIDDVWHWMMQGLFARGLSGLGTKGGLVGWRWILVIEGLLVCKFIQ